MLPKNNHLVRTIRELRLVSQAWVVAVNPEILILDEAERLDLVVKAYDPAELMPTVMAFAHELANKSPQRCFLDQTSHS